MLRLLTLWYRYAYFDDVRAELEVGLKTVAVDTWLVAVPQMMARIHVDDEHIIKPLNALLVRVGRVHPQALMHPLLVRPLVQACQQLVSRLACPHCCCSCLMCCSGSFPATVAGNSQPQTTICSTTPVEHAMQHQLHSITPVSYTHLTLPTTPYV